MAIEKPTVPALAEENERLSNIIGEKCRAQPRLFIAARRPLWPRRSRLAYRAPATTGENVGVRPAHVSRGNRGGREGGGARCRIAEARACIAAEGMASARRCPALLPDSAAERKQANMQNWAGLRKRYRERQKYCMRRKWYSRQEVIALLTWYSARPAMASSAITSCVRL